MEILGLVLERLLAAVSLYLRWSKLQKISIVEVDGEGGETGGLRRSRMMLSVCACQLELEATVSEHVDGPSFRKHA